MVAPPRRLVSGVATRAAALLLGIAENLGMSLLFIPPIFNVFLEGVFYSRRFVRLKPMLEAPF